MKRISILLLLLTSFAVAGEIDHCIIKWFTHEGLNQQVEKILAHVEEITSYEEYQAEPETTWQWICKKDTSYTERYISEPGWKTWYYSSPVQKIRRPLGAPQIISMPDTVWKPNPNDSSVVYYEGEIVGYELPLIPKIIPGLAYLWWIQEIK